MAKPTLKLLAEKSAHEKAMDEIEDSWRRWHGLNGAQWTAYDGPTTPWSAGISASLDRGRYIVKVDAPIPWYRRFLRWWKRI